jgi:hypothetical protein
MVQQYKVQIQKVKSLIVVTTMATSAAEPAWMTASFRPTNRMRDTIREWEANDFMDLQQELTEVELLPHLTPQDVLATAGIAWGDFCRFLEGKVVWITPEVHICTHRNIAAGNQMVLSLGADNDRGCSCMCVHVAPNTPAGAATETCDCAIRLMAPCFQRDVSIRGDENISRPGGIVAPTPLSGAALSFFFQESRSCLRKVSLINMALSEDLCRALATMSRLDVELDMLGCSLADDAAGSFAEWLQSDRGPVRLIDCKIDNQILANSLAGQSRVTMFKACSRGAYNADMALLFAALANNRGLVVLILRHRPISEENWSVLCESLQTHPTLTILDIRGTSPWSPDGDSIGLSDEQKAHRTRLLAEMVQQNTVVYTIELSEEQYDQQIYADMIHPYLETNRYRSRVHAIKKADTSLRRPLLGLALQAESVRNNSNLLWMFLSGNTDVVLQSHEDAVLQSNEDGEQVVEAAASVPAEEAENGPSEVAASRKRKH